MWVLLWVLKNWIAVLLSCSCLAEVYYQSSGLGCRDTVRSIGWCCGCHHCVCVFQVYWLVVLCHHCVCHIHWLALLCHHFVCVSGPLASVVMSSLCVCQVHWPVLLCHHCVCQVHWLVLLCHCMCVRSIGRCCYVIVCVSGPLVRVVMSSLCVSGPLASVVMSSLYVCQVH